MRSLTTDEQSLERELIAIALDRGAELRVPRVLGEHGEPFWAAKLVASGTSTATVKTSVYRSRSAALQRLLEKCRDVGQG